MRDPLGVAQILLTPAAWFQSELSQVVTPPLYLGTPLAMVGHATPFNPCTVGFG